MGLSVAHRFTLLYCNLGGGPVHVQDSGFGGIIIQGNLSVAICLDDLGNLVIGGVANLSPTLTSLVNQP